MDPVELLDPRRFLARERPLVSHGSTDERVRLHPLRTVHCRRAAQTRSL